MYLRQKFLYLLLALYVLFTTCFDVLLNHFQRAEYILRKNPKVPSVVTFENSAGDQTRLLPESHAWWSMPVDAREPRYLIVDPDKGPNSTLVGTWSKNEITETFAREYLRCVFRFTLTFIQSKSSFQRKLQ